MFGDLGDCPEGHLFGLFEREGGELLQPLRQCLPAVDEKRPKPVEILRRPFDEVRVIPHFNHSDEL